MNAPEMDDYDCGLINDWGGGNVEWWQDYIRAEIGRANEHWRTQIATLTPSPDAHAAGLREAAEIGRKALRDIAGMDLIGASAVAWNAAREIDAILARAAEGGSDE